MGLSLDGWFIEQARLNDCFILLFAWLGGDDRKQRACVSSSARDPGKNLAPATQRTLPYALLL